MTLLPLTSTDSLYISIIVTVCYLPLIISVNQYHQFMAFINTILQACFQINILPQHAPSYGKFKIRFAVVNVCNNLNESMEHLPLKRFTNKPSYCEHSWLSTWYLIATLIYDFISRYLVAYCFTPFTYLFFPVILSRYCCPPTPPPPIQAFLQTNVLLSLSDKCKFK